MQTTSVIVLLAGLVVATSFVGAAAFTSATVERDVTVGIETDSSAIIGLESGTADATSIDNDQLVIEPESGDESLNQEATFRYGDNSSASAAESAQAFNITNRDDVSHDFTLSHAQSSGDGSLEFYVSDGTNTDTVTTSSSGTITLGSGETAHVVVIVDTTTGTDDVSGTLTIDAT